MVRLAIYAVTIICVVLLTGCWSLSFGTQHSIQNQPTVQRKSNATFRCFGLGVLYAFVSKHWSQSGQDLWAREPFTLANIFEVIITNEPASGRLTLDQSTEMLWAQFFSGQGALIAEFGNRAELIRCGANETVLIVSGVVAGDGARTSKRITLNISRAGGKALIKSEVERTSSLLVFTSTLRRNYVAEFDIYTAP